MVSTSTKVVLGAAAVGGAAIGIGYLMRSLPDPRQWDDILQDWYHTLSATYQEAVQAAVAQLSSAMQAAQAWLAQTGQNISQWLQALPAQLQQQLQQQSELLLAALGALVPGLGGGSGASPAQLATEIAISHPEWGGVVGLLAWLAQLQAGGTGSVGIVGVTPPAPPSGGIGVPTSPIQLPPLTDLPLKPPPPVQILPPPVAPQPIQWPAGVKTAVPLETYRPPA